MVSAPFARVLDARRAELNARFALSRQRLPGLEPAAFGDFLREAVDPVVSAVHVVAPERVDDVALAAYDVALELVGQRLVDGGVRGATIRESWRRIFPAVARALALDPARVLAAVTNAAHQVAGTPGAHGDRWLATLGALGGRCDTPDDLLRLGQLAAWRAGLAHYRAGALAAAEALPSSLALAAVNAPAGAAWGEVARGLAASEWYDPAQPGAEPRVRVAATIGAFRGFGGLFVEPPRVALIGGQLHATSGDEGWLVTADRFGATFHRLAPGTFDAAAQPARLADLSLTADGALATRAGTLHLPNAGRVTSCAATATTLAVSWSHSHHITLVTLA